MAYEKEIAPDLRERVRELYEASATPLHAIARLAGISEKTLRGRAEMWGWRLRGRVTPAGDSAVTSKPSGDIATLAARIRTAVDREIVCAERNLTKTGARAARIADAERSARTLASLAKTLNELKRLEADDAESAPDPEHDEIDPEEFRRDLAQRLEALCAEKYAC